MKKKLLFTTILLLSGCTQQSTQTPSKMEQDCLDKGGEYSAEAELCEFADGETCAAEDYNSEDGCYPEQTGKRELTLCEGYEGVDVCTMQYDPVCAKILVQGKTVWQTFSNNCVACVSKATGYVPGGCESYEVIK
jgi:hypothetical protein